MNRSCGINEDIFVLFHDPMARTGATHISVAERYSITLAFYLDNNLACCDAHELTKVVSNIMSSILELPRSSNLVEGWHNGFRVSWAALILPFGASSMS